MAAGDHNPSRRALLGAAVALPFVGGGELRHSRGSENPAALSGSYSASGIPDQVRDDGKVRDDRKVRQAKKWALALAAYEAAEAELRAFEKRTAGAPWEAQEAVEREMDERLDALGPAVRRLMLAPAPDVGALARKIEVMVDQDVASDTDGEACLAALKRDAKRLALG